MHPICLNTLTFDSLCMNVSFARYSISADLSNMNAVRALVPEDISTFLIQLTVTRLQQEGPPSLPSPVSNPHHVATEEELAWIEPKVSHHRKGLSILMGRPLVALGPKQLLSSLVPWASPVCRAHLCLPCSRTEAEAAFISVLVSVLLYSVFAFIFHTV